MTTFGIKEPWMSPMNEFLVEHRDELKDFVDSVTTISPMLDQAVKVVPPSYVTPITILNRLSQASKEGFPSLPYLIDQPRAFAALVAMWLKHCTPTAALDPETREFDSICRNIRRRIQECVERAENAERPGSSASAEQKWEEVAEKATGQPARDGVYTRSGSRSMTRVAPCTVDDAFVGNLGYSVNVSSGGGKSTRSFGGILGFGGSKRKDRGKVEVGDG
jgi:hypothetical protein